ncbi:MAG: hypothetical protein NC087_01605 [Anaeroplasma bactoclasticum]|nr:hypothetical protein [Anaeroplasma bactoclasticum]
MNLCKIRFDGSHYLIQPYKARYNIPAEKIVFNSKEELISNGFYLEEKKDLFYNEWAKLYFPYTSKGRKPVPSFYKLLYNKLKTAYLKLFIEERIKGSELKEKLVEEIFRDNELKIMYSLEDVLFKDNYIKGIHKFVDNQKENLKSRKHRFKVKALNNEWNYFVTFTYDDKIHNEESFVKTLKKKLQNLHTNYGWLYMGCFERSEKGRLHFHGLLYVPEGAMRGTIREMDYYDTTSHKRAISFINSEFENKIGRNDFKPITKLDLTFTHALDYILKYIGKSDNKIVYSRGIKDDVFCLMDYEENIICPVGEYSPYYVCADTPIIKLTKNLDIDFKEV